MKELKKASQFENWKLEVECTGVHNMNGGTPCGRSWELDSSDIVKRKLCVLDTNIDTYGFICPECNCFTQLNKDHIPQVIIQRLQSQKKTSIFRRFKNFFKKL